MTTAEIAGRAGRLLAEAAPPKSKVILFGSRVSGEARSDSDFDFLVIEPALDSKLEEMIRLRDVLDPLPVAADVIVARGASPCRNMIFVILPNGMHGRRTVTR